MVGTLYLCFFYVDGFDPVFISETCLQTQSNVLLGQFVLHGVNLWSKPDKLESATEMFNYRAPQIPNDEQRILNLIGDDVQHIFVFTADELDVLISKSFLV